VASTQGVGAANEDTVHVSPTAVVVLDGLSAPKDLPMGCIHGTPWYVRQLGTRLINLIADDSATLAEALASAIREVNALHQDTCDLDQEAVPASTVVIIRERGDVLDYLVLSDNVLVLDLGNGEIKTITDKRVEEVAQDELKAALEGPTGTPEHAARVSELVTVQRRLRNKPGGYWVASTAPEASEQAITGTVPLGKVRQAALLTDGASRLVDQFHALTWAHLLDLLGTEGPAALIARTREAEESDPVGARWPRFKRSDDATAAFVRFTTAAPLEWHLHEFERGERRDDPALGVDDWKAVVAAQGRVPTQDTPQVSTEPAPNDVARWLQVEPGTPVVARRRLRRVDGEPFQVADSWFPVEIAEGSPLMEERDVTMQGGVLASTGHPQRRIRDEARADNPTSAEAQRLGVPTTTPVIRHARIGYDADGKPVRVMVTVGAGALNTLVYEMEV
jgi:hypothetical protein